jgi:hypothetical protein
MLLNDVLGLFECLCGLDEFFVYHAKFVLKLEALSTFVVQGVLGSA